MKNRRIFIILMLFFILGDTTYTFFQFYNWQLDGDIANGVLPSGKVETILDSPLGLIVFEEGTPPANHNRYFVHKPFYEYFNRMPLFLQNFVDPIDSPYLAAAIAKLIFHLGILFLLTLVISGARKSKLMDIMFAAIILVPLFQTNGFVRTIGLVEPSVTYTFHYAYPTILLLLYFLPLLMRWLYGVILLKRPVFYFLWILLGLMTSLSGPLNPGVALIISFLAFCHLVIGFFGSPSKLPLKERLILFIKHVPKEYYLLLLPISIFSFYSIYIGAYDSNLHHISLLERYKVLPKGIIDVFLFNHPIPLILGFCGFNVLLAKQFARPEDYQFILHSVKWISLGALIYLLLLPLGGYRPYRPLILRYDTLIPLTLSLFFFFAKTSIVILKASPFKTKRTYSIILISFLAFFMISDDPGFNRNKCQKELIAKIVHSEEDVVKLPKRCRVLTWALISDPKKSEQKVELLERWGILKANSNKRFYHE